MGSKFMRALCVRRGGVLAVRMKRVESSSIICAMRFGSRRSKMGLTLMLSGFRLISAKIRRRL